MHELQVFEHEVFGKIRVSVHDGDPIFMAKDVCDALELTNSRMAVAALDDDLKITVSNPDGNPRAGIPLQSTYIKEAGLYELVFKSRKKEAKVFRRWVCGEVLPSIRKDGGYIHTTVEDTPELIMAKALKLADATIKRQEEKLAQMETKIEEDKPKVQYATEVEDSTNAIDAGMMAAMLHKAGLDIGRNRLLAKLRDLGFLFKGGKRHNMPTQKTLNSGLMEVRQTTYTTNGEQRTGYTPLFTGKGKLYFHHLLMKIFREEAAGFRLITQQSML